MTVRIPRIVIAGTHSGAGKTSITLAVAAALKRRGLKVQTFKVGPDFLDPGHLSVASGRPCYNLDGWMCGRTYVEHLFTRVAADADMVVIEGVMGLFDGASPENLTGSTAEIAAWLQAPVILVVDTYGMAGSLAAAVAGYAGFEPGVAVAGVLANFCGSRAHGECLAAALASRPGLPPLVGAVPRGAVPTIESRHLGLMSADPDGNLKREVVSQLADCAENCIDLDALVRLARRAPALAAQSSWRPAAGIRVRLAVAHDKAFHFYYQDLFDELSLRGCEVVFFSCLTDRSLPEEVNALFIGGGYPEEHAEELGANRAMIQSIRGFVASGRPVYAECGGLIYLSQAITTSDGRGHEMLGILPAGTRMLTRPKFLGYVQAELRHSSLWGGPGDCLRGHEFHYSELLADPAGVDGWRAVYRLQRRRGQPAEKEGYQRENVLASYAHLHLASRPAAMDRFLGLCRK